MNIREHLRLIGVIGSNINTTVYEHNQYVSADTWTINHNLNTGVVQVWCYDEFGNRFEPAFKIINADTLEIYVIPAISGIAYIFPLDVLQG